MNNVLKYVSKESQYYPTPQKLIRDILRHIRFYDLEEINFLEPCAGDGSICREIKKYGKDNDKKINIECIEIEKVLRDSLSHL